MNYLPNEILNIIYKYKKELNINEINKEINNSFYHCHYCGEYKNKNITNICIKCIECDINICMKCKYNCMDLELKNEICLNCHCNKMYINEIDNVLERNTNIEEKERFLNILEQYDLYDLEKIDLINYLKQKKYRRYHAQDLYDIIDNMISYNHNIII